MNIFLFAKCFALNMERKVFRPDRTDLGEALNGFHVKEKVTDADAHSTIGARLTFHKFGK